MGNASAHPSLATLDALARLITDNKIGDNLIGDLLAQDLLDTLDNQLEAPNAFPHARSVAADLRIWFAKAFKPDQNSQPEETGRWEQEHLRAIIGNCIAGARMAVSSKR